MHRRKFLKYFGRGLAAVAFFQKKILAEITEKSLEDKVFRFYKEVDERFELNGEEVIIVDGPEQKLYLVNEDKKFRISKSYDISTGKKGFGNEFGSGKTPVGIHRIKEKYGTGAPSGTIFKARRSVGKIAKIYTEEYHSPKDLITSRIMWLDGCEEKNKNTFARYIYIHGTPEEGLIGSPVSHGCIRMKNRDVIELYKLVKLGTYVNIKGHKSVPVEFRA